MDRPGRQGPKLGDDRGQVLVRIFPRIPGAPAAESKTDPSVIPENTSGRIGRIRGDEDSPKTAGSQDPLWPRQDAGIQDPPPVVEFLEEGRQALPVARIKSRGEREQGIGDTRIQGTEKIRKSEKNPSTGFACKMGMGHAPVDLDRPGKPRPLLAPAGNLPLRWKTVKLMLSPTAFRPL